MKVTVILPIYNVEHYIEKCIRSIFEQTYKNIEFVFVNDCSEDDSIKIVNELINEYKPNDIKIIHHETNMGLPSARNSGLTYATGDYILHCDSDDWMDNTMVERMIHNAIINSADIVFCDFYNVYFGESVLYKQREYKKYEDYINAFMHGISQASVWNKLIKRSLYLDNNVKFPDNAPMLEDFRTIVQLYYYADKISYCSEPLYFYVKSRENSISGYNNSTLQKVREDYLQNVNYIINFLEEKEIKIAEKNINRFKLGTKKNLLVKGRTIAAFKSWKNTFPETNGAIWETDYPLVYKFLAYTIAKEWWLIAKAWIYIKYDILRK